MANKPIALARLRHGGHLPDGQEISFRLEALGGRALQFTAPYETLNEIIQNLLMLAAAAKKARGGHDDLARLQVVQEWATDFSNDGQHVVVILEPNRVPPWTYGFSPSQAAELSDALRSRTKEWPRRFRRN